MTTTNLEHLQRRLLERIYEAYTSFDPSIPDRAHPSVRMVSFKTILTDALQEYAETTSGEISAAISELVTRRLVFPSATGRYGINFENVGDVEDILAEAEVESAPEAQRVRATLIRRFKDAHEQGERWVRYSPLLENLGIENPAEATKHIVVLLKRKLVRHREPRLGNDEFELTEQGASTSTDTTEQTFVPTPGAALPERVPYAITFLDIVQSTQTGSVYGNSTLIKLQTRLVNIVQEQVSLRQPQIVNYLGDGFLVAFDNQSGQGIKDAIDFTYDVVRDVDDYNAEDTTLDHEEMRLRIGVHVGEVQLVEVGGRPNVMGVDVAKAQRIQSLDEAAHGLVWGVEEALHRILVSEQVVQQDERLRNAMRGQYPSPLLKLRGLADGHQVHKLPPVPPW